MGQRQLDLLVPQRLTIGADGAHPPSNLSGTCSLPATNAALATMTP